MIVPPDSIMTTFDRVLAVAPERKALVTASSTMSYEEFDAEADAAAAALLERGVRPGDRVAASLPNDMDIVVAFHGIMRVGAIWVGINKALAVPEKEELLAASMPALVLAEPETADAHSERWATVAVDPSDRSRGWPAEVAATRGARRLSSPDPTAPAAIAFTSGTTGAPKGIVHSQENLLLPAAAVADSRGYDEHTRKGDCLPLTILNLQVLTSLVTSAAGGTCVLTERRDAKGVSEWLGREAITVWNGVPAMLHSMVHDEELDPATLVHLGEVWTGGSACPLELIRAFEARFGAAVYQTYGLTEAPTIVSIERIGSKGPEGSSGVALPHLDVHVRDDDNDPLPDGSMGEICVGPVYDGPWAGLYHSMLGTWCDGVVEKDAQEILHTGDIGVIDESGNLFVRDRKKLLIIRGGANVYPAEVERVLESVPGVSASAVVGIDDERLGQRVVAVVEVTSRSEVDEESLLGVCRQSLARYKVPERILIVDVFPRNAMGKIVRASVQEMFDGDSGS
jgi:acyl-CoA synthetase (AMP-forming)/AMP-acid ligase II